jgi:hypothetical protein
MTEEKIISRIQKMLAIANDLAATEGERDNALRMAYNLMAKHNLEMATIEAHGKKNDEPRVNFPNVSWSWQWARHVNHIVAKLFFCKYYYHEVINGTQITHHFIGRESNAMTAAVMADYVVNSILKEARKLYKSNTSAATRSFATGAMHRLSFRVDELIRQKEQEFSQGSGQPGTALVLASLYAQEDAANELVMPDDLRVKKARSSKVQGDAYYAGQDFGGKINLSAQLAETAKKQGQLK